MATPVTTGAAIFELRKLIAGEAGVDATPAQICVVSDNRGGTVGALNHAPPVLVDTLQQPS